MAKSEGKKSIVAKRRSNNKRMEPKTTSVLKKLPAARGSKK